MNKENLLNKKFGELTVLCLDETKTKRAFWLCKCSCGQIKSIAAKHLKQGSIKTCRASIHKIGKLNPNWSGHEELGHKHWWSINRNARIRGLPIKISISQAWQLFLKQKRRCVLSGILLSFSAEKTASLDRINSSKGYTIDNVQWVHKTVNKMKMELSQEVFIKFCKMIAEKS